MSNSGNRVWCIYATDNDLLCSDIYLLFNKKKSIEGSQLNIAEYYNNVILTLTIVNDKCKVSTSIRGEILHIKGNKNQKFMEFVADAETTFVFVNSSKKVIITRTYTDNFNSRLTLNEPTRLTSNEIVEKYNYEYNKATVSIKNAIKEINNDLRKSIKTGKPELTEEVRKTLHDLMKFKEALTSLPFYEIVERIQDVEKNMAYLYNIYVENLKVEMLPPIINSLGILLEMLSAAMANFGIYRIGLPENGFYDPLYYDDASGKTHNNGNYVITKIIAHGFRTNDEVLIKALVETETTTL